MFITFSANAAEINCYSGKVRIYHGFGKDFVYQDEFLAFTEYKSNHIIIVSGDCIVMSPLNSGDRFSVDILKY